jgi:hypothetical protein
MRVKSKRDRVDSLIDHLWQHGYLTLSRKFGKYLPAPPLMGEYEIDAVARYKKKIALGITASEEDINDPSFLTKLDFLANYHARFPEHRVTLFLGVPYNSIVKASLLISSLDEQTQKHIKIVTLSDSPSQ